MVRRKELRSGVDFLGRISEESNACKKHQRKPFIDKQPQAGDIDPAGKAFPVLTARKKKQKPAAGKGKAG